MEEKKAMKKYRLIFLIISLGFLFNCNDGDIGVRAPVSNFNTSLDILNEDSKDITISPQGIPVKFSFSFRNVSGETQTVQFSDAQQYDLEVYNSQGALVWNWANEKAFPQSLTELVFDPGEIKAFEESWDQTSNEGLQVPAGIYNVYVNRNWNTDMPDMSTGPVQIEIYESIVGTWNWYETSGGIGGITDTPESTGETRKVVFQDNGNVVFYTNDEVTLSSTYLLASKVTIISDDPLPVVIIDGIDAFYYIYSFPYEDELELQENVVDGFIHNYRKVVFTLTNTG